MTVKQSQCLLCYLGLYNGAVDGIRGPLTKQAEKDFLEKYPGMTLLDALAVPAEVADPWEGVRYFKAEEFRCKCGGKFCDGFPAQPDPVLLTLADRVRAHFGAAAIVSSGVRCKTHNANVGGAAKSRHMSGKAMDFRVSGKTAAELLPYIQAQPETRYAYAINDTYVHMDVE